MDLPSPGQNILANLPLELFSLTCSFLPNRDIKSLRLTNRAVQSRTQLRLSRVFVSASPQDIAVLRSVADHEHYRRGVKEIVWDDAVLPYDPEESDDSLESEHECPHWFVRACEDNKDNLRSRYSRDRRVRADQMIAAQVPVEESWAYFQQWRSQQAESIVSNADAAAFVYALQRFPSLRSVQVTAVVHGHTLGFPLYETPALRALPRGINYPLPHGWMATGEAQP